MAVLDSYPKEFKEALATHEFFRKLGFSAENIFIHLRADGMLMMVLEDQGKRFAVNLSPTKLTEIELRSQWPELVGKINGGEVPGEELDAVWVNSYIFANKVDAVATLLLKGFHCPKNLN
jgi:hypothetical protein